MNESMARERIFALESRHQALKNELKYLTRRAYLTPSEQRVAQQLKKEKLSAKDELVALRRSLTDER